MFGLIITGIESARGLYADGPYFLLEILRTENYFTFDKARLYAQLLIQAPVIFAIRSGINDINILIRLHSFGFIAIPIAIWMATLLIHIKTNYFWLFLMSFSVTYLNSGFFPSEYNLCYSVTAFCSALLIKEGRLGVTNSAALLLSSIALTRFYESMILLGPMLCAISMFRLFVLKDKDSLIARYAILLSALFFAVGTVIAAWSIMFPRSPEGVRDVTMRISLILNNKQIIYTFLMVSLFLAFCNVRRVFVSYVFAATMLLSVGFLLNSSLWAVPYMHYDSRIVAGLGLFCTITLSAVFFFYRQGMPAAVRDEQIIWVIPFTLFASLVIPLFIHTFGFLNWARSFEREVTSHTGVIQLEDTKIYQSNEFNIYTWGWANPSLSVLLKRKPVDAIIKNSPSYKGWQPFDPEGPTPNLLRRFHRECCL